MEMITIHKCFLSCIFSGYNSDNARKHVTAPTDSPLLSCNGENASNSLSCKKYVLGIDPGLSGAIAVIQLGQRPSFVAVFDIPTKKVKNKNRVDLEALSLLIETYSNSIKIALIEEVGQVKTKADPFSSFVFGFATGSVHGVLAAFGIRIQTVKPNIWKAALGLNSDKNKALNKAKALFPRAAKFLTRKKDHDRAEAILLAWFACGFIGGSDE